MCDVENIFVINCKEPVTGPKLIVDIFSDNQPNAIFTKFSSADHIVSHGGAKQESLIGLSDEIVERG